MLSRVLVLRLNDVSGLVASKSEPSDLVLSTTADLTPQDCAELVAAGSDVLILAIVPNEVQRRDYEAAGARYVPMTLNAAEFVALLDALQTAAEDSVPHA